MYKPIGMMKHKYISPNTDTIKCTIKNICNSSSYYNDEPPVTENIGAKENGDIWGDIWADDTEENNEETTKDIWA